MALTSEALSSSKSTLRDLISSGRPPRSVEAWLLRRLLSNEGTNPVDISESFRYAEDITLDDAIHRAIRILKTGFQGEMDENNIEIGMVTEDKKFVTLSPAKIKDYLEEPGLLA